MQMTVLNSSKKSRPTGRSPERMYFVRGRRNSMWSLFHRWRCMKHGVPFVRFEYRPDEWGDAAIVEIDMTPTGSCTLSGALAEFEQEAHDEGIEVQPIVSDSFLFRVVVPAGGAERLASRLWNIGMTELAEQDPTVAMTFWSDQRRVWVQLLQRFGIWI